MNNVNDKVIAYHEQGNDYRLCVTREDIAEINEALGGKEKMEELIKALKTIQDECNNHTEGALATCNKCPFGDNEGHCLIMERTPDNWQIIEPKTVVRVME